MLLKILCLVPLKVSRVPSCRLCPRAGVVELPPVRLDTRKHRAMDAETIERELAALRVQMEARMATLQRQLEQLDRVEKEEE